MLSENPRMLVLSNWKMTAETGDERIKLNSLSVRSFQASIRKKPQYVNFGAQSHICGATLIGNCWAITAEHCFLSKSRKYVIVNVD